MGSMAGLGMLGGGRLSGLSMMGGLGGTALRFAPLAGPKSTYVWALPGAYSAYSLPAAKPKFEVEFAEIVGLDPDAYEPALVKLTQTRDNWRLVGAAKDTFDKHGNEKQSAITEDRTQIKTTSVGRGHVIIEAAAPLAPGEYGIVLHPIKAQKSSAATATGLTAEQTIFYSVWDFSVSSADASAIHPEH